LALVTEMEEKSGLNWKIGIAKCTPNLNENPNFDFDLWVCLKKGIFNKVLKIEVYFGNDQSKRRE
jgi:hypothetical protein